MALDPVSAISQAVGVVVSSVTQGISGTQQRNFEREQYQWAATQDKQQYTLPTDYNKYILIFIAILIFILLIAIVFKAMRSNS